jgi:hypothetical protein
MKMDTAHYINTLKRLVINTERPIRFDYAVLDLAADKDLLRVIYEAMAHEPVEWQSLFLGGRFQKWWESGPILVDVCEAPAFQEQLLERLENHPIGVLLRSDLSIDTLFPRLVYWTNDALGKEGSLLRFHEPRMFGPLVCGLSDGPVGELTGCGSAWYWHDTHSWQSVTPSTVLTEDQACVELPPGMVTQAFVDTTATYRLAADARGYAHYYRGHLPEAQEPDSWVLQRLLEGQEAGLKADSHLERWLRLSIQHGEGFHQRPAFKSLLMQESLTSPEKLTAMESEPEVQHATA